VPSGVLKRVLTLAHRQNPQERPSFQVRIAAGEQIWSWVVRTPLEPPCPQACKDGAPTNVSKTKLVVTCRVSSTHTHLHVYWAAQRAVLVTCAFTTVQKTNCDHIPPQVSVLNAASEPPPFSMDTHPAAKLHVRLSWLMAPAAHIFQSLKKPNANAGHCYGCYPSPRSDAVAPACPRRSESV
jgi:hypothetical protein